MFSRILVPLDGSARAEQAIPVAARLARNARSTLELTRVVGISPELTPYFALPPTGAAGLTTELLATAHDYLADVKQREKLLALQLDSRVLTGMVAQELLQEIEARHVDFVVMTSHGRTGFSRWLHGSVAQHIARHSQVPTLILRESDSPNTQFDPMSRRLRILVPLDGSKHAEAIITPLVDLISELHPQNGVEAHLVCVIDPNELDMIHLERSFAIEGAGAYLERVAAELTRASATLPIDVRWSVVPDADAANVLVTLANSAEERGQSTTTARYDLVAMATHGRGGFARWAFGSVAERVFENIEIPILLVRPADIVRQSSLEHRAKPVEASVEPMAPMLTES